MCFMLWLDIILIGLGVCFTCMALNRFRRDLSDLQIKINFMQIREEHREREIFNLQQLMHSNLMRYFDDIEFRTTGRIARFSKDSQESGRSTE